MPRIKSINVDTYYAGKGNRVIHVPTSEFEFDYEYADNKTQLKKCGRTLRIRAKGRHTISIALGGREINTLKRILEIAEQEMKKSSWTTWKIKNKMYLIGK